MCFFVNVFLPILSDRCTIWWGIWSKRVKGHFSFQLPFNQDEGRRKPEHHRNWKWRRYDGFWSIVLFGGGGKLSGRKARLLNPGVRTAGVGGQEIRAAGLRHMGTEGRL